MSATATAPAQASSKTEAGAHLGAIARLGTEEAPLQRFALAGGAQLKASSLHFDRAQISPVIGLFSSLPHGDEIEKLNLYLATDEEIGRICGEHAMACYDPGSERMLVSGESEEVAGISRAATIAHEYGHHIANNRRGGLWPALYAGTPRWSTYEDVCELTRSQEVFPGDQGMHYWENPGEAFAQSYSQMVYPQASWHYSPLLQPDAAALERLRQDVVDPWRGPLQTVWKQAGLGNRDDFHGLPNRAALGSAAVASSPRFRRLLKTPVDGRVTVRLKTPDGGRYKLELIDPETGSTLARSTTAGRSHLARIDYASCGHSSLLLRATPVGEPRSFEAKIATP